MSEAKVKPSLETTLVLSDEAVKKVSTRMFWTFNSCLDSCTNLLTALGPAAHG
jgi:hypothetical protein